MSVGGPQLPPSQQGIDSSQPLSRPGEDSGKVKKDLYTPKEIGKKVFKLASKALKHLAGHRSVQKVDPQTVQPTTGLKQAPARSRPSTPIAERGVASVEVPAKLAGNAALQRHGSVTSLDSAFVDDDNLSIVSTDSLASIRSDSSDEGYSSVHFNDVPDIEEDLEDEDQYQKMDFDSDSPDSPEVNESSNETIDEIHNETSTSNLSQSHSDSEGDSGGNQSDDSEGQQIFSQEPVPDEPTTSTDNVKARKYQAYQDILNGGDFGALDKKLANTNSYETVKNVARMALQHSGNDKSDLMFQIAQNRMQEIKADQLFDELGGYQIGADYDGIREEAQESLKKYPNETYRQQVFDKLDAKLQEYETRFEGETPFSHVPPPLPPRSEPISKDIPTEKQVEDEPPPLPQRPETPTKKKTKNKRGLGRLFRRDR